MKPESDPESSPRYRALLELLRTADSLLDASRRFFVQWDLSPSQFNILNLLRLIPQGLTQTDLSRKLITHRSNVTGLIDRLEKRGLVERLEVAADRRAYHVRLTPAGIRGFAPRYAAFLEKHATPIRTSVVVADPEGATWWVSPSGSDASFMARIMQ